MPEKLVVVDERDNVICTSSRDECHQGDGKMHRAICALVFNDKGDILVQRRSRLKQLWPQYYDVSCATHVYSEETYKSAGERRLPEELGFSSELEVLAKFGYQSRYVPESSENEMCALLVGRYNGEVRPNRRELDKYEWISPDILRQDISSNPERFTPWFLESIKMLGETKGLDEILGGLSLFKGKIAKPKVGTDLKPEYYQVLTEIGTTVDDCVEQFYQAEVFPKFPEKERIYGEMLRRKTGKQKLRAMAAYLAFAAFSNADAIKSEKVRRVITSVELENWSNYELNWLFDGKAKTGSVLSVKEAGLATHGFFNDALRLVLDIPEAVNTFMEINDRVHRGWTPELYDLSFRNTPLMQDFEKFWQAYRVRNVEAGGQFYKGYVTLAFNHAKHQNHLLHRQLSQIYQDFGECVQIINDLGDLAIPKGQFVGEKEASDQFADLRNGVVTWPSWLMYHRGSDEDKKFFSSVAQKRSLDRDEMVRVSRLFHETGAYGSIRDALKEKERQLNGKIHCLDIDSKVRGLIKVMVGMLSSNRIFHTLDENCIEISEK